MSIRSIPGSTLLGRIFKAPPPPGALSASEFERVFDRECALVYRHDHSFSLIVFVPAERDESAIGHLAAMLYERLRIGDVVGRLDDRRLAAILPYTDGEQAWTLADQLVAKMAAEDLKFDCTVYTFPHAPADEDSDESRPRGPRRLDPVNEVDEADEVDVDTEAEERKGEEIASQDSSDTSEPGERVACSTPPPSLASIRADGSREAASLAPFMVDPMPFWKRTMDVVVSGTALLLLSPVLATIALSVRLSSPGPIIFRQQRAGVGGVPFTFYKFRSMYIDAEERKKELAHLNESDGPVFKMKKDPRVTPIGGFLRKTSLDELPQLWNVLKGDMTLVGPRPATLDEVPHYEKWQRQRLNIRGGITCTWQVSGRSDISFEDWMRMDARYVEQSGFLKDVGLLVKTATAVATGRGAY